jgi:cytochrome P450
MTENQCPHTTSALGTRYQPFAGEQLEDPYAFYAIARREEPIFFSDVLKMWIVTRYDDVRAVLKEPTLFSSKDSIKSIAPLCPEALAVLRTGVPPVPFIINTDPPEHSRFRRVINRAFSGARIQALESQICSITQSLLDALAPQGRAEVISALAFPLPLRVIACLCDIDDRHIEHLKRWGQDFLALMSSVLSPERQVAVAQSVVEYQYFLREHIARKREHLGEDVTSELIAGSSDAPFSEPELVHQMMGLVFAGHETTTHLIGNALYHLLREPTRWAELVAHPAAIPAAIEEVLRIEPPIPTFIRTATANTALGGVRIAAGENVLVVFGSANHDEHHFPEPERFDLHRHSESAHMGFGWGTHFCSGAQLARLEGRIVLEALTARWPNLRLAPGQQLHWLPTLMFRGVERLEIEWS